jgi:hypothetical protein
MKKVVSFILTLLFTLTFAGCQNDASNGQDIIKHFLTAYYTVNQNDYKYYESNINGTKETQLIEATKTYEENTKKFQQYLTDKSYEAFYAERLSYLRIDKAYKSNVFIEVKDIKMSKYSEDKKAKTIVYEYEVKLNETNKDTKKSEVVKVNGNFTVIASDGGWKIVNKI